MLNILNQFKRMYTDDGQNDKTFVLDEMRLRWSLANLKHAIDRLNQASQTLHDILTVHKEPPSSVH